MIKLNLNLANTIVNPKWLLKSQSGLGKTALL